MLMTDRLNVLMVVLEGARADHVCGSGYARETTPFLDALARDGVRFRNMIATAPGTLSSHAALFTGAPQESVIDWYHAQAKVEGKAGRLALARAYYAEAVALSAKRAAPYRAEEAEKGFESLNTPSGGQP